MYFSVVTLVLATFFLTCFLHDVRGLRNIRSLQESHTNNINSLSSDLLGKSDVGNAVDADVSTRKKIADLAEKLPSDRLLEDPVLLQTIDRINQITTYSLPFQDNPDVIFQRLESDNLKEVVVLSANEDHLYHPNRHHKNVYAVLRRVPNPTNSKPVYYFLFYAYLRPLKPEDDDAVIDVGGKRFTVEWDTWDDRSKKSGWPTCDSTIFFSCEMEKYSLNGSTNTEIENINFNAEVKEKLLTKIKTGTNEAYDLNLYYGLFGEYDEMSSSAAQGRALNNQGRSNIEGSGNGKVVCGAFSIFKKPKCDKDGNRSKNPKIGALPKNGDLLDLLSGQINPMPPSANQPWPQKTNNVLIPTYGSLYQGKPGNPAIFVPANKGMPSIFIADVDGSSNSRLIYGEVLAPSVPTGPITFRPQDKQMMKGVYNIKGTFIPDGLTDAGLMGGIHGSLSERPNLGVFVTDVTPRMIYLDPKLTDPKSVFFNPALMNGPDGVSETTLAPINQGPILGTIYDSVQGGTRIFIPDGEGIPGYFLPSDPTHPAFGNAPHGDFYPDKFGAASFFPDSKGALARYRSVPGAFGPDSMDEAVFIFGKMSYAASGGVFIPNYPGKAYSYVKDSPDVRSVWAPFSTKTDVTTQAPLTIKSKNPEHYGVYFQGIPPIFFPQGKELAGSLMPSDNRKSIKGTLYPAQPGYPALFDPDQDDVFTAQSYKNIKAKFLPEALVSKSRSSTHKGISGTFLLGNRGRNNSFYPDVASVPWYYDPDRPDEGVWSPTLEPATTPSTKLLVDLSTENKLKGNTLKGKMPEFISGQYFKGNSEAYGMFIPDDLPEVLGTIIPDSNMYPQLHGSFSTGKVADSSMISLETPMQVAKSSTFAGKFFPDGLKHPSQGVKGIFTTLPTSLTEIAFRPDTPSKVYLYKSKSPENSKIWAPNIPGVTAEENSLVTTEATTKSEETAASNDQGVFGILYPGIGGSKGVFLPDEQEVSGTILFDSASYSNMHGKVIAGKYGNPPLFYSDDPAEGSTLFNVAGTFMPDWMPTTTSNQGIRGRVTAGDADNCVIRTDMVGKAYWYIKGRLETQKIWSPLTLQNTTQEIFRIQNGPTEATANMKAFVEGSYFQGDHGVTPIFIPNGGTPGYITPLIHQNAKTAGVLYPEEPPNFVPDTFIYIPNGTTVQFISTASQDTPSPSLERFTGTFIQGTITEPPIILPNQGFIHGWSNIMVNNNESTMTHNYTFLDNKWVNSLVPKPETIMKNGIAVGGGYRGYETGGDGFEGAMDAKSPIFKEFLEKRTSKLNRETGKNFEVPQNVILIDSSKQKQSFYLGTDASIIESSEYREWLNQNYMIKRTRIKTATINEIVEIAVPIQAEKYITLKNSPKPWKINLKINSEAGAGGGAGGEGGSMSKGAASGGVTGNIGNCKSFSTSANAVASSRNGSRSKAEAHALNGGTANALSNSKDNSNANSKANVERGGLANAKANAQNGVNADAASNAYGGGKANVFSNSAQTDMNLKANAIAEKTGAECDGGLPDEIVVESSAVANAIGGDGSTAVSANTQVKIDMAGIVARLQSMMSSKSGQDDDDSESRTLDININAFSNANSQSSGRSFNTGSTLKSKGDQVVLSGWKTGLDDIITPNSTLAHDDTLFFGIGQCPFVKKTFEDLQRAEKPEEIVAFYLTLLRMDCSETEKVRTLLLIVDGFLELDDKTLRIPDNHIYINESKLTSVERQRFSRAFEMSMFTRTVVVLGENLTSEGAKREAPDGSVISASVKFITEHILNCLIEISMSYSKHFVSLTRNSILTLRSILTKLRLDAKKLESCDQCSVDKNVNRNDRIQINTLLQFIYHGLPPFTLDAQNIRKTYKSFFVTNVNSIEERLVSK